MILNLKILIRKICLIMSAYNRQLNTLVLNIKALNKVYNRDSTEALTIMLYWPCHKVFHNDSIFFTTDAPLIAKGRVRKGVLTILTLVTIKMVKKI